MSVPELESHGNSAPSMGRGHPYSGLARIAAKLASDLELTALRCNSSSERKRLQLLAAGAARLSACLSHSGVKLS